MVEGCRGLALSRPVGAFEISDGVMLDAMAAETVARAAERVAVLLSAAAGGGGALLAPAGSDVEAPGK
jgi:hypothetical protein